MDLNKNDINQAFSDFRHGRYGRRLSERELSVIKSEFDTFKLHYIDEFSIGDTSTYDKVVWLDVFTEDNYYFTQVFVGDKYYYYVFDGMKELIKKIKSWEKIISKK